MDASFAFLDSQKLPRHRKQSIEDNFLAAVENRKPFRATCEIFLKSEVLYEDYRPRAVIHQEDHVRFLVSGLYSEAAKQIYQSPRMIKHLDH